MVPSKQQATGCTLGNLFVAAAYAPADEAPDDIKNHFYRFSEQTMNPTTPRHVPWETLMPSLVLPEMASEP